MTLALRAQPATRAVAALFGATMLVQVGYPLTSGAWRDTITVLIVGLAAAAALLHSAVTRGARSVIVLAATATVGGFAVEVLGVHTGYPFGRYSYAGSLGTKVFAVPIVVAFAWTMLAWPAALAAARLCQRFGTRVLVGAWALASWDLFLDPQMVAAGHWRWSGVGAHLPGVPSVPLTDYLGWLAFALVISTVLQAELRRGPQVAPAVDLHPVAFYAWTWLSSALALAVFLGLPAAALWGTVGMGVVGLPAARYLRTVWPTPAGAC